MLPLISADRWSKVVHVGPVSQLLSPSLRIGDIAAPTLVASRTAGEVMTIDRQGDPVMEQIVAGLLEDGAVRSHTRRALRVQAARRQAFADALRARRGGRIDFDLPDGGLALRVRFDASTDALVASAASRRLAYTPGSAYATRPMAVAAARPGVAASMATNAQPQRDASPPPSKGRRRRIGAAETPGACQADRFAPLMTGDGAAIPSHRRRGGRGVSSRHSLSVGRADAVSGDGVCRAAAGGVPNPLDGPAIDATSRAATPNAGHPLRHRPTRRHAIFTSPGQAR